MVKKKYYIRRVSVKQTPMNKNKWYCDRALFKCNEQSHPNHYNDYVMILTKKELQDLRTKPNKVQISSSRVGGFDKDWVERAFNEKKGWRLGGMYGDLRFKMIKDGKIKKDNIFW